MIVERRTYTFRLGAVDGWMNKNEREGALDAIPTQDAMILNPARSSPAPVMERS